LSPEYGERRNGKRQERGNRFLSDGAAIKVVGAEATRPESEGETVEQEGAV